MGFLRVPEKGESEGTKIFFTLKKQKMVTIKKFSVCLTIFAAILSTMFSQSCGPIQNLGPDTSKLFIDHAIGLHHSLGINQDNTLYAWGDNSFNQLGRATVNVNKPLKISSNTDWATVYARANSSMAIKQDGSLWGWGNNATSQLGVAESTLTDKPVLVNAGPWKTIAMGQTYTIGIKQDGTLWGWGSNSSGQLGLGNTLSRILPTQIGKNSNWSNVSAGWNHSMAINSLGELYAFGRNTEGQFGNQTTQSSLTPLLIPGGPWKAVSTGKEHSMAIKTTGTLWGTGRNNIGQLGIANLQNVTSFVQVDNATNWFSVVSCTDHNAALKIYINSTTDYLLYAWGDNTYGQLGDGNIANLAIPTQTTPDATSKIKAGDKNLAVHYQYSGGFLMTSGDNTYGQVGHGNNANYKIFKKCSD